ncbi:MAG: DinB family protein [Phycisphaerae bacterium]|nr:DinB family protein [Gemmatimonadaceae bacterium]
MTRVDALRKEFTRETTTARRHLERLPTEQFDWRPHPKSSTAGQLASHIVDCIRWVEPIFGADELDYDQRPMKPSAIASPADLLRCFDDELSRAMQAMQNTPDIHADQSWRLKMRGKVWFEKSREDAFRDMTLHHIIHHRGQFTVYLRLLNVAVPGSYGPTADER